MDHTKRKSHAFRSQKELHTAATTWKTRTGRVDGPDEYIVGDLVSSIMLRLRAMPQRERQELYGCPVLVVGVCSATGLVACDDSAKLYCSVRASDEDGVDLKSCQLRTALAAAAGGAADFDDVLVLGTSGDLDRVATLTLRIKRYNGSLRKQTVLGEVSIPLRRVMAIAQADLPLCDVEYSLRGPGAVGTGLASAEGAAEAASDRAAGRLRIKLFLHYPPPDPRPIAIHVAISAGRTLLPRDVTGFSDPYVKVRPLLARGGKAARDVASGRGAEFKTSTQIQTLDPVWPDHAIFVDGRASPVLAARLAAEDGSGAVPWGAFAGGGSAVDDWVPPTSQGVVEVTQASGAPAAPAVMSAPSAAPPATEAVSSSAAPAATGTAEVTAPPATSDVKDAPEIAAASAVPAASGNGAAAPATLVAAGDTEPPSVARGEPASATLVHPATPAVAALPPATCSRIVCDSVAEVQGLHLLVMDWDAVTADDEMGECFLSFSSLFGDEDAVVGTHTLCVRKWVRLRPTKSLADSGFDLGHIQVHVTLVFEQPLLPPLWQESVDAETGLEYYYNARTRESQWNEPAELLALRSRGALLASAPPTADEDDADEANPAEGALPAVAFSPAASGPAGSAPSDTATDVAASKGRAAALSDYAAAGASSRGAADGGDDDDVDDFDETSAALAAQAVAALPIEGSALAKATAVAEYSSPLGGGERKSVPQGATTADRDSAFFLEMKAAAEERKRTEDAKLRAKLASMTQDERAEFEAERANEERREQRKSRMLHASFGAYASATTSRSSSQMGVKRSVIPKKSKSGRQVKSEDR